MQKYASYEELLTILKIRKRTVGDAENRWKYSCPAPGALSNILHKNLNVKDHVSIYKQNAAIIDICHIICKCISSL
jgi:hypothetical protein